jgi:diacylglycerol kinase (ATP)
MSGSDVMEHSSIAVVVNPERRDELEEFLEELGDRSAVRVIEPEGFDEFVTALSDAAASSDAVAAIGGDGTQRSAAHALKGSSACLAVVPAGTVNLLARVLGIESIEHAASAIRGGHRRTLDTGIVGEETFVLNASTGYDAAVIQRVDDSAKRWGRLGYFVTGLSTLSTQRPAHVEVTVDGETFYTGRAMTVMVTNVGERGSAEMTIAPGSAPDDGLLDVVVQRSDTAARMARMLWALRRGRTPRPDDLLVAHGREIDVRWAKPVAAQRDGDATGQLVDAQYRIDPGSLTVCVPETDGSGYTPGVAGTGPT